LCNISDEGIVAGGCAKRLPATNNKNILTGQNILRIGSFKNGDENRFFNQAMMTVDILKSIPGITTGD